jgi:ubiquinone/menaquinone biosynthesis C-methylase UbiE
MMLVNEIELQRQYYERTSPQFDAWHIDNEGDSEHVLACELIVGYLHSRAPEASLLDIGGGTGRFYCYMQDKHPHSKLKLMAIEPSAAQRRVAYAKGVPETNHIEGDATNIAFADNAFDYCTEFGVVHHIMDNRTAVREMCRVASKGVFLSDCNRYGQGTWGQRILKQGLRHTGLWKVFDYFRTSGKGYQFSEADGIYYSFSVFDVLDVVRVKFPKVYVWSTLPVTSPNMYSGAAQVLVFATR